MNLKKVNIHLSSIPKLKGEKGKFTISKKDAIHIGEIMIDSEKSFESSLNFLKTNLMHLKEIVSLNFGIKIPTFKEQISDKLKIFESIHHFNRYNLDMRWDLKVYYFPEIFYLAILNDTEEEYCFLIDDHSFNSAIQFLIANSELALVKEELEFNNKELNIIKGREENVITRYIQRFQIFKKENSERKKREK